MDPIQLRLFLDALKKGDSKKASELADTITGKDDYHRGYRKALSGIVASVENKEVNSLFVKMISGGLTKKKMEEQRRNSKKISKERFRPASERGYEKAWYDILSIFLGKKKVGLDKHTEGELY
jgi:hypothetical protein